MKELETLERGRAHRQDPGVWRPDQVLNGPRRCAEPRVKGYGRAGIQKERHSPKCCYCRCPGNTEYRSGRESVNGQGWRDGVNLMTVCHWRAFPTVSLWAEVLPRARARARARARCCCIDAGSKPVASTPVTKQNRETAAKRRKLRANAVQYWNTRQAMRWKPRHKQLARLRITAHRITAGRVPPVA